MNARIESKPGPVKNRTTVERKSDREVIVTRTINGPARIVFEAFTKAELLKRWWVPKSMGMTLLSCEVDARVGGKYLAGQQGHSHRLGHPPTLEPLGLGKCLEHDAFPKAELLKRWWVPKSMGMPLLSCEVDARVGGKYRLVFDHEHPPRRTAGSFPSTWAPTNA